MKTGKEELIEVENRIEKVLGKLPSMPSIQTLEDQLAVSVFTLIFISVVDPDPYLIRIGSVFNRASGSGSVFGIRIRIQEGKNDPQN
jgi:hypothetical protein